MGESLPFLLRCPSLPHLLGSRVPVPKLLVPQPCIDGPPSPLPMAPSCKAFPSLCNPFCQTSNLLPWLNFSRNDEGAPGKKSATTDRIICLPSVFLRLAHQCSCFSDEGTQGLEKLQNSLQVRKLMTQINIEVARFGVV